MSEIEIEILEGDHNGEQYFVCRPQGDIDAYSVGRFREVLASLAEAKRLIIDLSFVPFMDSAGLGALIGGIRRVRDNDGRIVVACSNSAITRLLHTTGFDRIVPVTETFDASIEVLFDPDKDAGL